MEGVAECHLDGAKALVLLEDGGALRGHLLQVVDALAREQPPVRCRSWMSAILRLVLRPLRTGQQRSASRSKAALGRSAKVRPKLKTGPKVAPSQREGAGFEPSES